MLNLFQHLLESITYRTLKRVQGDRKRITTQPPSEREGLAICILHLYEIFVKITLGKRDGITGAIP